MQLQSRSLSCDPPERFSWYPQGLSPPTWRGHDSAVFIIRAVAHKTDHVGDHFERPSKEVSENGYAKVPQGSDRDDNENAECQLGMNASDHWRAIRRQFVAIRHEGEVGEARCHERCDRYQAGPSLGKCMRCNENNRPQEGKGQGRSGGTLG